MFAYPVRNIEKYPRCVGMQSSLRQGPGQKCLFDPSPASLSCREETHMEPLMLLRQAAFCFYLNPHESLVNLAMLLARWKWKLIRGSTSQSNRLIYVPRGVDIVLFLRGAAKMPNGSETA